MASVARLPDLNTRDMLSLLTLNAAVILERALQTIAADWEVVHLREERQRWFIRPKGGRHDPGQRGLLGICVAEAELAGDDFEFLVRTGDRADPFKTTWLRWDTTKETLDTARAAIVGLLEGAVPVWIKQARVTQRRRNTIRRKLKKVQGRKPAGSRLPKSDARTLLLHTNPGALVEVDGVSKTRTDWAKQLDYSSVSAFIRAAARLEGGFVELVRKGKGSQSTSRSRAIYPVNGEKVTLAAAAAALGITKGGLSNRLARMPMAEALDLKNQGKPRAQRNPEGARARGAPIFLEHNGETLPLTKWAKKIGISYECLKSRHDNGWPAEKVLAPRYTYGTRALKIDDIAMTASEWQRRTGIGAALIRDRIEHGTTGAMVLCPFRLESAEGVAWCLDATASKLTASQILAKGPSHGGGAHGGTSESAGDDGSKGLGVSRG
jgi:hypothetical protein